MLTSPFTCLEFTVFRFVSVIFPFLMPLMDKMNITVNSSEALQFFISVIKKIKEERKNKPKVTHSLCWDWCLCVGSSLTSGFSLCRIFQDRVDFMQLMLNAQAPDGCNQDGDSAGRAKVQTRGHLQDIKIFSFLIPQNSNDDRWMKGMKSPLMVPSLCFLHSNPSAAASFCLFTSLSSILSNSTLFQYNFHFQKL